MIRRRRNHKAGINRLFRDQINPLKIFDDVESCVKFRYRRVRILAIVDELQEAIEHQLTRQAQPQTQCSDSDIAIGIGSDSASVASVRCSSTSSSTSAFQVRIKYENNP